MSDSKTSDRDVNRAIRSWLHEDRHEDVSRIAGAVLDQVDTIPQRRATWWPARRTPIMNRIVTIGLGAAAVVAVVLIGSQLLRSPNFGSGDATPTPTPTTLVTPARELPTSTPEDITAGSYFLSGFPVGITFEIPAFEAPATWFACSMSAVEQGVCHESAPDAIVAVSFQIVDNVVADPCSDQETAELLDPAVGPSVDDLVTAISSLEGFEATTPVDITVDGFEGKEFTLTAPPTECGLTWATADRTTGMGPREINLLQVLDVDSVRVLISGVYGPETSEAGMAAMRHVMDSVQIEP